MMHKVLQDERSKKTAVIHDCYQDQLEKLTNKRLDKLIALEDEIGIKAMGWQAFEEKKPLSANPYKRISSDLDWGFRKELDQFKWWKAGWEMALKQKINEVKQKEKTQ
jgi:hypothetical protein